MITYIFSFSLRLKAEIVNICMHPAGNRFHFIALGFLALIFLDDHHFTGVQRRTFGIQNGSMASVRVSGGVLDRLGRLGSVRDMFLSFLIGVI